MSARSTTQNTTGSVRGSVKLAGEEAKDRMYEPKHKKKVVRVLTVIAYVFSVSLAAIMLSLYYIFIWQGTKPTPATVTVTVLQPPDVHCRPAATDEKNVNNEKIINIVKIPMMYNESEGESDLVETPRALPSREEPPTVPVITFAQHLHNIKKHADNYTSLVAH